MRDRKEYISLRGKVSVASTPISKTRLYSWRQPCNGILKKTSVGRSQSLSLDEEAGRVYYCNSSEAHGSIPLTGCDKCCVASA